jgi:UDP-N-acetylglucosamine:LPS N-acetylglucosamine transferase
MPTFKICLCFSDTGGGHRSAVEAIDAGIKEVARAHPSGHKFQISFENIIEKTHPLNRGFVDLYNFLLRHNQAAMRYYYWFVETIKPNNSEIGYQIAKPALVKFLERENPDLLVSAHPMCNHYLARVLKETQRDQKTKLITVITDPNGNFWRGWACPESELTLVPNNLGEKQLLAWGVPAEKIRVVGMPVHPDFSKPAQVGREEFLQHLKLDPSLLTICINAGWAGGGNMLSIYKGLARCNRPLQVLFLCGHNNKLYRAAKLEAMRHSVPTAVLPFHDRMPDLMNAVDLMVTKAGGLTTFEALARRLPLAFDMISMPMPQEMGTVKLLVEQGLAYPVQKPFDLVHIIDEFRPIPDRMTVPLPEVSQLNKVNAAGDIARFILSYCDPLYAPTVDAEKQATELSDGR